MELNKSLEILIVEDSPRHIQEAQEFFGATLRSGFVKTAYATTANEAITMLGERGFKHRFDAAICDLFIPTGMEHSEEEALIEYYKKEFLLRIERRYTNKYQSRIEQEHKENYLETVKKWSETRELPPPAGIFVSGTAHAYDTPVIITQEHVVMPPGKAFKSIELSFLDFLRMSEDRLLGFNDISVPYYDNEKKNWDRVYLRIIARREGIQSFEDLEIEKLNHSLKSCAYLFENPHRTFYWKPEDEPQIKARYQQDIKETKEKLDNAKRILEKYGARIIV